MKLFGEPLPRERSEEPEMVAAPQTIGELLRDICQLTDDQIERIGSTLMALEERMTELCDQFGLTLSDLNLDLGPLGTLLPQQ